jgi:hypothetical protein
MVAPVQHRLEQHAALIDEWRALTQEALLDPESACLPGWSQYPYALSKIPRSYGSGRGMNPDATYRSEGWRQAVIDRFGFIEEQTLNGLETTYNQVVVAKITPLPEVK